MLDRDPRARAAHARRRRRLVPAEPHRRRLRPRAATVERLAARGDRAAGHGRLRDHRRRGGRARAGGRGMDVVVTDHHAPRADGALPDAPIVHPRLGGYPCPDLCAAGVAYKLAAGAAGRRGRDPAAPTRTSTSSRSPPSRTSCRCAARTGALVRAGLRALARDAQARAAGADGRSRASTRARWTRRAIGFRLAPRINAAGRLQRADAGLELLLTDDPERARADRRASSTRSTPSAATSRRASGSRPRRRSREQGPARRLRARRRGLAPGRDRHRRRRASPSATTARRC